MEVGPWRWDEKSEYDFWIKPGGWEEYATIVYGASFHAVAFKYSLSSQWISLPVQVSLTRAQIVTFIQ